MPEVFQRAAAADHHTLTRGARQPRDDRHRRREQQRTRSRHHQHRDRPHSRPARQPRRARDQQRQRQEPRGVAVGQPHDRRAFRAGLFGQPHDARVRAVLRGRGGAQLESVARVDHTAADRFADGALDLQRFTGQHRFVQHGHRVDDAPVHRHHLARADDQQVVDRHLGQRYHAHLGADASTRESRRVLEQRPQIVRGAALGRRFERTPAGQHHRDQRARQVLADEQGADQRQHRDQIHPGPSAAATPQAPTAPRAPRATNVPAIQHAVGDVTPSGQPRDPAGRQRAHREHHQGGFDERTPTRGRERTAADHGRAVEGAAACAMPL